MAPMFKNRTLSIPFVSSFLQGLQSSFLVRRRPKWKMSKEWVRPPESEYQMNLHWEGFISPEHWKDDNIADFPLVKQDLADLEEHLMPIFWDFNQKASYYQNNYYKFQWVFMLGAFFTTVLAVLTGYYGGLDSQTARFLIIEAKVQTWVNVFGILTTILSGATTYYNYLSSHGEPRKRWASYRRLTEELRMTYFKFLSRTEPFDHDDRVDKLRKRVLDLRRQERENG
jgi:hypothetical protein